MVTRSADDIERFLLRPGPWYLLALLLQPKSQRDDALCEAAAWLGLERIGQRLGLPARHAGDATRTWMAVLDSCGERSLTPLQRAEFAAILREIRIASRDEHGSALDLHTLWEKAARHVTGVGKETLRGRHWPAIRTVVAQTIASVAADDSAQYAHPRSDRRLRLYPATQLADLDRALGDRPTGDLLVLGGPPGSGATSFAVAYVESAKSRYSHIYWLRAADPHVLHQDFLTMARLLTGEDGTPDHLRRRVLAFLETDERWLIVFSDVQQPSLLFRYLPFSPAGSVLCTTETTDPEDLANRWRVASDPMTQAEVPSLPYEDFYRAYRETVGTPSDDPDLPVLWEKIKNHRLAVHLCLSLLREGDATLANVVHTLRDNVGIPMSASTAPEVVAALALDVLDRGANEVDEQSLTLLRLLARFRPHIGIPAQLITSSPAVEPADTGDPRLTRLTATGLLDWRVHWHEQLLLFVPEIVARLVRESDRYWDTASSYDDRIALLRRVVDIFEVRNGVPSATDQRVLPHAETVATDAVNRRIAPVVCVEILTRASICHLRSDARLAAMRCIDCAEKTIGDHPTALLEQAGTEPGHRRSEPEVWQSVTFLREAGFYEGALRLAESLNRAYPHIDSGGFASVVGHIKFELALAARDEGDYRRAEQLSFEAAEIWRGADERWHLAAEFSRAFISFASGDYRASLQHQLDILDRRRGLLDTIGSESLVHAEIGRSLDLLGRTRLAVGNYREARQEFEEALAEWTLAGKPGDNRWSTHNKDHALSRSRLALCDAHLGDHRSADEHSLTAVEEILLARGREHRDTSIVLGNRAVVLMQSGAFTAGFEFVNRSVELAARHWGRGHRVHAKLLGVLAKNARLVGRLDRSFECALHLVDFWSAGRDELVSTLCEAECWVRLAETLLDYEFTQSPPRPRLLELVERIVVRAVHLLDGLPHSARGAVEPDLLTALCGLLMLAPRGSVGAAQETLRYVHAASLEAAAQCPTFRTRYRAAVAVHGIEPEASVTDIDDEVDTGKLQPLDALEVAVAKVYKLSADLAFSADPNDRDPDDVVVVRQQIEACISALRSKLQSDVHQAVSRGYVALAQLAGPADRKKAARNLRESDRARPSLDWRAAERELRSRL